MILAYTVANIMMQTFYLQRKSCYVRTYQMVSLRQIETDEIQNGFAKPVTEKKSVQFVNPYRPRPIH